MMRGMAAMRGIGRRSLCASSFEDKLADPVVQKALMNLMMKKPKVATVMGKVANVLTRSGFDPKSPTGFATQKQLLEKPAVLAAFKELQAVAKAENSEEDISLILSVLDMDPSMVNTAIDQNPETKTDAMESGSIVDVEPKINVK